MEGLTSQMNQRLADIVVFDLETTGFYPGENEIIEIGAVRVSSDLKTVQGEFNQKITPLHIERADPKGLEVNGYTPELWKDSRPAVEVLKEFADFAKDSMLAGYNIAFDWGFLKHEWYQAKIQPEVDYHFFDVMSLVVAETYTKGRPQSISLTAAMERLGIPPKPVPHRALEDAKATLAVLQKLLPK